MNIDIYLSPEIRLKKQFKLAGLPSSEKALQQHLYRIYHQVYVWYGNEKNAEW